MMPPSTASQRSVLAGLLKTMRPHQWVKNGFVLTPLIFAKKLEGVSEWWNPDSVVTRTLAAFLLFCVGSGLVYLLNDLVDREKDQLHPQKKSRPIPPGRSGSRSPDFPRCRAPVHSLAGPVAEP